MLNIYSVLTWEGKTEILRIMLFPSFDPNNKYFK